MAATVGGSIESCTIDSRRFSVAADADADRDLGGFTNEVQPNGDGTARLIKTRKAWKIGGVSVNVNEDRGDPKFLQDIADKLDFVVITITLASGHTYSGLGTISGDLNSKTMSATADIEFSGEDKLESQ